MLDETDESADVQFEYSVIDSGDILITATKNGYLPYQSEMKVLDSSSGIPGREDLAPGMMVDVSPNPVTGPAVIRFSLPVEARAGSEARVDIYDASGRLVRSIPAAADGEHAGELTWNRRLESGAEAPSGIYFLKLSDGAEAVSVKFVLLK